MSLVACEASFHPLHPYPLNTQHHKRMYLACICTTVLPCSFCWVRASVCFNLLARGQSLISQPMALSLRWFLCTMLTARMRTEDPAVLFHHNPQGPLSLIPSSCTYMWNGDISSCRGCSFFFLAVGSGKQVQLFQEHHIYLAHSTPSRLPHCYLLLKILEE